MMPPSLTTILDQIADSGFLVNNLFQIDRHLWRANLCRHHDDGLGYEFAEFAEASDPITALELALDKIETTYYRTYPNPTLASGPSPSFTLASLGLAKLPPPSFALASRFRAKA